MSDLPAAFRLHSRDEVTGPITGRKPNAYLKRLRNRILEGSGIDIALKGGFKRAEINLKGGTDD